MADMVRTVSNTNGDVVTYVEHEKKVSLFTFDADTSESYVETLVKTPETDYWTYLVVGTTHDRYYQSWSDEDAAKHLAMWQDTQGYVDGLMEKF